MARTIRAAARKDPASAIRHAETLAYVYDRRREGYFVREIADMATKHFGRPISKTTVARYIQAAIKERVEPSRDAMVAMEFDTLAMLDKRAQLVMDTVHYHVDHGVVMKIQATGADGKPLFETNSAGESVPVMVPLINDEPVLRAIDRRLKIQERRTKLKGYDAPTKIDVGDSSVRVEVVGVDLSKLR